MEVPSKNVLTSIEEKYRLRKTIVERVGANNDRETEDDSIHASGMIGYRSNQPMSQYTNKDSDEIVDDDGEDDEDGPPKKRGKTMKKTYF